MNIEDHLVLRLKKLGFDLKLLRPVASSCVNFVYECRIDGSLAILKANFFGRSMLYCYDQFLHLGPAPFRAMLQDYERAGLCPEIMSEVSDMQLLRKNMVPVPTTMLWCSPNIVAYERLETLTKLLPDATAEMLSNIHKISAPHRTPSRDIRIQDGLIVINDYNFIHPIIVHNVSPFVISLLEKAIHRSAVLLHGDLKRNNLLEGAGILHVIDPKLCTGIVEMDIGKLLLRELLASTDQEQTELVKSVSRFLSKYSGIMKLDTEELEVTSIVLGLIELQHLLRDSPRQNLDMLGDEMPRLYRRKNLVSHLCNKVLRDGKVLGIRDISHLAED